MDGGSRPRIGSGGVDADATRGSNVPAVLAVVAGAGAVALQIVFPSIRVGVSLAAVGLAAVGLGVVGRFVARRRVAGRGRRAATVGIVFGVVAIAVSAGWVLAGMWGLLHPMERGRGVAELTDELSGRFSPPPPGEVVEVPFEIVVSVPGVPELEWVSVDVLLSLTRTDTVKSDTSSVVTSAGDELEDAGGLGYLVNEVLTCEGSTQPVCRASLVAILDGGVSDKATATWRVRANVRDPDITGGIIPEWAFLELTSQHAVDGS